MPSAGSAPRRKPTADLYTALLVLAFVAVLVAILFLYLELAVYDFKTKPGVAAQLLNRLPIAACNLSTTIPSP